MNLTRYGFDWGPAKITRCCSDRRGGYVLLVTTKHVQHEVRITPKGTRIVSHTQKINPRHRSNQ